MSPTRGVIFIHSAAGALRPHIEWAIDAVLSTPVQLRWTPQPAQLGTWRTEVEWTGPAGTVTRLAQALLNCARARFEVVQDARPPAFGQRYCYTPSLGVFSALTGSNGDILVDENRLRAALDAHADNAVLLVSQLDELLGAPWDAELEEFRYAGADTVRWLHAAG